MHSLAHRRQVVAAARRRQGRRARQPKPIRYPSGVRAAYLLELRAMLADVEQALKLERGPLDAVLAMSRFERGDSVRHDNVPGDVKAVIARILERVGRVFSPERLQSLAERLFRRLDAQHVVSVRSQLDGLVGVDVFGSEPWLETEIQAAISTNVGLMRDIGTQLGNRIEGTVWRAVSDGLRVEELYKQLRDDVGMSRKRAAFVATDQIGKAQGKLTELRHKAAGITEYVWSTSQDERVRASHSALNQQRFRYDDPPVVDARTGRTANPGQDYRCRCAAIPVMPEL